MYGEALAGWIFSMSNAVIKENKSSKTAKSFNKESVVIET